MKVSLSTISVFMNTERERGVNIRVSAWPVLPHF